MQTTDNKNFKTSKELLEEQLLSSAKSMIRIINHQADCKANFIAGNSAAAYKIGSRFLRTAVQLHLTDAVIDFATACRYYCSVVHPDARRKASYTKILEKHRELKKIEEKADDLLTDFVFLTNKKKKIEEDPQFIQQIEKILLGPINFQIGFRCYYILAYYLTALKKEIKVLEVCENALNYFDTLNFKTHKPSIIFAHVAIPVHIKRGSFELAAKMIEKYTPNRKDTNYFKFCQCKALLFFYSKQYENAYNYVHGLSLYGASKNVKEEWEFYKGFASALSELGLIPVKANFNIGKLLNQIENYASDKTGFNINLIILEILFYYARNNMRIHDREPAIKRYILRHTKPGDRSNILLKGLLKWINNNFSYDFEAEQLALARTAPESIDLEIIPYRHLIKILQKKCNS